MAIFGPGVDEIFGASSEFDDDLGITGLRGSLRRRGKKKRRNGIDPIWVVELTYY